MEPSRFRLTYLTSDANQLDWVVDQCLLPACFLYRTLFGQGSLKVYRINRQGDVKEDLPSSNRASAIHTFCMFLLGTIAFIPATLIGGILKGVSICRSQHQFNKEKLQKYLDNSSTSAQQAEVIDHQEQVFPPLVPIKSSVPDSIVSTPSTITSSPIRFTPKLYETPTPAKLEISHELEKDTLNNLLNYYPKIDEHRVAQGSLSARQSILTIYREGLAFRLGENTPANNMLIQLMRYIISKINDAPSPQKKKNLLIKLSTSLEDCVPVTMGRLNSFYLELSGQGSFPSAFSAFFYNLKNKIVDLVIDELYPEMQNDDYATENYHEPQLQHPHTKNAYLKKCGSAIGFEPPEANSDSNATRKLKDVDIQKFQKLFKEKLESLIVKEFVIAINKQQDRLPNELFFAWGGQNGLGGEIMYNESYTYPSYANPLEAAKEMTSACITESTAIKALRSLGLIA